MSSSSRVFVWALLVLQTGCAPCEDLDNDGWNDCDECDDSDASVYPRAPELCDGLDNDCDGRVGDDIDEDNDGWTPCTGDCDDTRTGLRCDWVDVAGATSSMCALAGNGNAVCWGLHNLGHALTLDSIHGGCCAGLAAGIDELGVPWSLALGAPVDLAPPARYIRATKGWSGACYLNDEGGTWCSDNIEVDPGGFGEIYTDLALGSLHWCAIREDTTIRCVGIETPEGSGYTDVESASDWSCALRDDGSLECWGYAATPPAGRYSHLSMGRTHACALGADDGRIVCWPEQGFPTTAAPNGEYVAIASGGLNNCALRVDGVISCWGGNEISGALDPPE